MENVSRSVACQLERGIAPNGCPQLPNLLRFKVIFRTFSFPPSLPLSPFAFHLASPILQGVNKKLSYRGQDAYAFSVIKHTNTIMTPNMYLSVHQSRIPGVLNSDPILSVPKCNSCTKRNDCTNRTQNDQER